MSRPFLSAVATASMLAFTPDPHLAGRGPIPASSSESRAQTRDGYRQAYDLNFDGAYQRFTKARRADPADPAPLRAIAAVTWMEILFVQGVATYTAFQGNTSGESVARPAVPPHLTGRFTASAQEALVLAEKAASADPGRADAQYQLGATLGLLALYRGSVEGRTFAAFKDGKRAVAIMKGLGDKDPAFREAALIPGIYRYAVSILPWHKRLIATVAGLPGDKLGGIELLEKAAAEGADTTTDAALVLMIAYNREGRQADASRHLRNLLLRHPGNRLLRLNLASTALDAGDHAAVIELTTAQRPAEDEFSRPRVTGERALWAYVRGTARAALGDPAGEADLHQATQDEPRDWIRARAHVELARLAFRAGHRARGKAELEAARHFGRRANDDVAVERAEQVAREERRQ